MGASGMVQQWTAGVKDLFPTLHGHTGNALARFSFAMCLSGHCHSGPLAAAAVCPAKPASVRRQWERLLANARFEPQKAMGELARSMLEPWSGRELLLVLDETPGPGGLYSMRLCVAYGKRVLCVAAECYEKDKPPVPMPKLIVRLIERAAKALPPGAVVTFLCDRGLSWPSVMDAVRGRGWGHVLRLQKSVRVIAEDGKVVSAGELVKRRGKSWEGRAAIFKKAGWRDAYVSVVWDKRCKEPWILAATEDGRRGMRAAACYAKRGWCEQSFRDEKSGGLRWDQSRLRDPVRLMKLLVVMTLATVLAVSTGTWLVKSGKRRELDPHLLRRMSYFNMGMRWLHHLSISQEDCASPPYLPYLHPT
jgi:hypothetical protein